MRIGVDVGGTHTDAVLMHGMQVVASHKALTTSDVESGVLTAIKAILDASQVKAADVHAVMIGTTQFTNAVIERNHIEPTAIIRAALPTGSGIPPMSDWPDDLAQKMGHHIYMIKGGVMFNGLPIADLDLDELDKVLADIKAKNIRSIAVSAAFSPSSPECELMIAKRITEKLPDANMTLSHTIGRLGLLERENAAMLNASLYKLACHVVGAFERAMKVLGLTCPFYISQNDGTLMSAEFVAQYPALTFSSGPTNSLRGAAVLSGLKNAVVVDIGGTTSDVGILAEGFPRESHSAIRVGGVRTNFRMPDIQAIGLGGGSLVSNDGLTIGPRSVGHKLVEEGLVFGGQQLTTSDILVAAGFATMGDSSLVKHLPDHLVKAALNTISQTIDQAVDRMRPSANKMPVILVGGGAVLVQGEMASASEVRRPKHAEVANAIGASIAQVGGEVERIVSYSQENRNEAIASLKKQAEQKIIAAGANPDSMRLLDIEEVAMSYMDDNAARVRVKMVGDLLL